MEFGDRRLPQHRLWADPGGLLVDGGRGDDRPLVLDRPPRNVSCGSGTAFWYAYPRHHPSGKPERLRHKDEFLAEVGAELDDIKPINPEQAARAVFSVLEHHIAPGEIEDIKATLPAHLRELWP